MPEEVGSGHGHPHPRLIEGLPELPDDGLSFGVGRTVGDEVAVVEADAVGPELGQMVNRIDRVEGGPGFEAEGISSLVPHGPEAEREVIRWLRLVVDGHGRSSR